MKLKLIRAAILCTVLALSVLACNSSATDNPIFPTGPVYKIVPNLVWGTSTTPGFNNNYFFTPSAVNESVCVYVKNNNTTNSHTFTASISITPDPANITPSDGTWSVAAASSGILAATSPGFPAGIGVSISGVAQVSINFSASTTQAGSPDTASVTIVQTSGNCFSGNQFIGSAPQSVSSLPPIQSISDGLSQSFFISNAPVNPTNGQQIVGISANSGSRTIYFDRIIIVSTVATTENINLTTGNGTCTPGSAANEKIGSASASTSLATISCTVPFPTIAALFPSLPLSVNVPVTFDLRGIIAPAGSLTGVSLTQIGTPVGTVTATIFWYEK